MACCAPCQTSISLIVPELNYFGIREIVGVGATDEGVGCIYIECRTIANNGMVCTFNQITASFNIQDTNMNLIK